MPLPKHIAAAVYTRSDLKQLFTNGCQLFVDIDHSLSFYSCSLLQERAVNKFLRPFVYTWAPTTAIVGAPFVNKTESFCSLTSFT